MVNSEEPDFSEPNAGEITDMELNPSDDVEMAENNHSINQDGFILKSSEAERALHNKIALEMTEIEPSTRNDANMAESDQPFNITGTSPIHPAVGTTLPDISASDNFEYLPSITDDFDILEDFDFNPFEEPLPKIASEFEQFQNGVVDHPRVALTTSYDGSSIESSHLGDSLLDKPRSEKALSEVGAQDVVPVAFDGSEDISMFGTNEDDLRTEFVEADHVSPIESTQHFTPAEFNVSDHTSPVDNATLPNESSPLNLGQSSLGKPKALNLGSSCLGKPASQATRERAKALQERLAKQFAEKNVPKVVIVPSRGLSPPGAGKSTISDASDGFTPSEFDESAGDIHPEQAEFETSKLAYLLKKRAGTVDIESDVAFLKAEAKEMARRRKAVADEQHERELTLDLESESEGLFMTPLNRTPASHAPASSENGSTFFTNGVKGRKHKGDDSNAMAPPTKKQARKSKALTGRSLGAGKGGMGLSEEDITRTLNAMQSGSKQPASKKTKASGRLPSHNISNIGSMMAGNTDVFRDAEAVAGHSNQPAFTAGITRKDFALRDLIASVPQDERPAAAGDKKFLDNSLKDFDGQGSCRPSDDGSGWTLKGMKCTLKHYQVLGVAFMRKRENREEHPRGGILADEMGLGKTIQMIANIINGKPKQGQPRTTLIVASPALISQWYAEIKKFTMTSKENKKHGIARIIQHRAGYRQGGDDDEIKDAIMESDICLTTYGEINKSYPKADVPADITTERGKTEWWKTHFEENKGVFHDMKFLRVVLDEAQAIKNHTSHSSMACRALKSEYYWAISGTPLVMFLRHPHTGSMRTFQANFCSANDPTGTEKLGVFLRQIIIRRTHKDLLFGARLLDLPTPKQNVIYLEFNAVERTVYEIVKQRFIQRINTITRRHGINSQAQYSHIWTMLLRLRQICSHVLLIQDTILDLLEREDFEKLDEITREVEGHSQDNIKVLEQLGHILAEHTAAVSARDASDGSVAGIDVDIVPGEMNSAGGLKGGSAPDMGKKHGRSYPFQKYLTSAAQSGEMIAVVERQRCCSCRLLPDTPQITSCHHIYCKGCMKTLQHTAARANRPAARCKECGEKFHGVKELPPISTIAPDETDVSTTSHGGSSINGSKVSKKKKDKLDWIGQPGGVLPSAKTIACKAQILAWLKEVPTCKIIVYTQFLPMIRIMGKVCQGEGWGHLQYSGTMSQSAREKALQQFSMDKEKKVMLMSLKCGGLGLNIVAASRVILLDPWWNDAVEQQAFCRVFRIGQVNETRLTRLCIKSSMDSAMFAVKERKTAEIDEVMEQSKAAPRSTHELLKLFGPVGDDEDGRPGFIFPDDYRNEDDDEVAGRFYEREEGPSLFGGGRKERFMGNDM